MRPIKIRLEDSDEVADIELQKMQDLEAVEHLLDVSFGPDRHQKTAYRLRDNVDPIPELSFVARLSGKLVGTLRFWPIVVKSDTDGKAGKRALLLGPIAVEPSLKGRGIGIGLMNHGLARARQLGHKIVILVGDPDYYKKVGFSQIEPGRITMPGPVDTHRLLALELEDGALANVSGRIMPGVS